MRYLCWTENSVIEGSAGEEREEKAITSRGSETILFADVVMPGMNGFELAKHVKNSLPGIKLLFMSGYIKPTDTHGMIKLNNNLIEKPIHLDALAVKIREMLG